MFKNEHIDTRRRDELSYQKRQYEYVLESIINDCKEYWKTHRKTINGPIQMISHAAIVPRRYCVRCSRVASVCASYKSYERP